MPRIRISSYNIHSAVGLDGKRDAARIAHVINELNSDVVALQEVDSRGHGEGGNAQLDLLVKQTGLTAIAGPTIRAPGGHYGNALLTRLNVLEVVRHKLDVMGREPRGAIEAVLDLRGEPIRVLATHLGLSRKERRMQVSILIDRIRASHGPLVVLGDWNEWFPLGAALRELNQVFGSHPSPRTFPPRLPILALDRIWVRPREALISIGAHRTKLSRVASDHVPVVAELRA